MSSQSASKTIKYYIYSPAASQAQAITGFLRKYVPSAKLIGVYLPGEVSKKLGGLYHKYISLDQVSTQNEGGIHIPTNAESTELFLKQGNVSIGGISLTTNALTVFNKTKMMALCKIIGIPAPQTFQSIEEIEKFPVFYKSKFERGGGCRGIAQKPEDLPPDNVEALIYQELIESDGTYGVGFVAKEGEILCSHSHFEPQSMPSTGGSAVVIRNFKDARLNKYTQKIIKELNYSGWGLAEFKYCPKRDDFVFMEINAKFWASCEFSFVNEPAFLELLFGIRSQEKPVEKIVFVNRFLTRGPQYVFGNIGLLFSKARKVIYKGWGESIIQGFFPKAFYIFVKTMYRKIKGEGD